MRDQRQLLELGAEGLRAHFQEWRHALPHEVSAHPNTDHFRDITRIKDVLHAHLRRESERQRFVREGGPRTRRATY